MFKVNDDGYQAPWLGASTPLLVPSPTPWPGLSPTLGNQVDWVIGVDALKGRAEATAVVFTILTLLMMINQIGLHLHHNEHAGFRTYTIRILLMVPLYSFTSFAALHNPSNAIIWALIRDCYECVVLLAFMQYCLTYLGGPEHLARYLVAKQHAETAVLETVQSPSKKALEKKRQESITPNSVDIPAKSLTAKRTKIQSHVSHPLVCWLLFPCCPVWKPLSLKFTRPWALGAEFVRLSLLGTLQVNNHVPLIQF